MDKKELQEAEKALKETDITAQNKNALVAKRKYLPTGHTLLDLVVGGGSVGGMGYPTGTICRDHGDSSSAKSFKATECIAASRAKYKSKFRWAYRDVEHGNTIDTKKLYKFDMINEGDKPYKEIATVEDWMYDLNKWLDSIAKDEVGIYVLDSFDALTDEATQERKEKRMASMEKGKEFKEGTYGMTTQKFLSQEFFRELTTKLDEKNCMLYIISQERDNVNGGMYGKKNRTSGGRAMVFYSSVQIESKAKHTDMIGDIATDVVTMVTADKARHSRPYGKCQVTVIFSYGLDDLGDCIDYIYDLRTGARMDLKKNTKVVFKDKEMERNDLINYVGENNLLDEIHTMAIGKWEKTYKAAEQTVARPRRY